MRLTALVFVSAALLAATPATARRDQPRAAFTIVIAHDLTIRAGDRSVVWNSPDDVASGVVVGNLTIGVQAPALASSLPPVSRLLAASERTAALPRPQRPP